MSNAVRSMALVLVFVGTTAIANPTKKYFGSSEPMGRGSVRTFFETDRRTNAPVRIGVVFDRRALKGLPQHVNDYSRCFDVNGDGVFGHHECLGDYETILWLPPEVAARGDIPFQWVGLNWNPEGHVHPAPPPWALPHFDFHFYIQDYAEVQAIRTGTCGELIDCDDFVRATTPVPAAYMPAHHLDVGAAVPAMGNHLIDTTSPELNDPNVIFTHTWIYGAYDGRITFYEPMITYDFLASRENVCKDIHLPQAWEQSGWYPTAYCIRSEADAQTVTLENFVYRQAQ